MTDKGRSILKVTLVALCVPVLQTILQIPLTITEMRSHTAQAVIQNISTQPTPEGYVTSYDIVQPEEPAELHRTITVITNENIEYTKVTIPPLRSTHYTKFTKDKPIEVKIKVTPQSLRLVDLARRNILTPTNILLVGTFATLLVAVMAIVSMPDYTDALRMSPIPRKTFAGAAILLAGAQLSKISLLLALIPLMNAQPLNADDTDMIRFVAEATSANTALSFLCIVTVAPIFEELLFRGYILRQVLHTHKPTTAIAVSTALFAVAHTGSAHILNATILGAVLGYTFYRTESLLPCIALHAANNLLAFLATSNATAIAGKAATSTEIKDIPVVVVLSVTMALLFLGAFMAVKGVQMLRKPPQPQPTAP